ncbi:MAG: Bifunctional oligoribonuclease and PAP phosphatase NrnA [Bacteroidetes bacterium ADurb.Bin416]|nr:MAG: Bifunctional oligoribonuclease and PAP phosphatase NrnA [Bacteroidetes bacterium ADurb.Bin416]
MLTKILDEGLLQKAKHLLESADKVAILSHTSPDGDALGSTLALAHHLTGEGKEVKVLLPDPFPGFLAWLPGAADILVYTAEPDACVAFLDTADVLVFIDFNQPARMGGLADCVADLKAKTILMDHHPHPAAFADIVLSYPQIASSSEIVFRYICRTGSFDVMTTDCASCVYTGMMTDTGAFTFNSNNEEMYYIISQLIRKGIDKDAIYSRVYNTYTADRMRLMGLVLYQRMQVWEACRAAIITLSIKDLESFDYQVGDTEGFVNLPLSIEGVDFTVFLREETDRIKLSFRSKGSFPANKVAADLFGGGGHLNAAGGEFKGSLADAVKRLEERLPDFIL